MSKIWVLYKDNVKKLIVTQIALVMPNKYFFQMEDDLQNIKKFVIFVEYTSRDFRS